MAEETVNLPKLAHRLGAEYRTLHKWAEDGLLGSFKRRGQGRSVSLTPEQAHLATILVRLRKNGLDYKTLKRVARKLRQGDTTCPLCGGELHD